MMLIMHVILMGVSGVGKTAVGQRLSAAMGLAFADADDFHPQNNVEKMRAGIALTDEDRRPWLDTLNSYLRRQRAGCVMACSALKEQYRQRICGNLSNIHLVYLKADRDTIAQRMKQRQHFMPPSLLDSQLATWEEPTDAKVLIVDATQPLDVVVAQTLALLSR
jgi:gluconokinase